MPTFNSDNDEELTEETEIEEVVEETPAPAPVVPEPVADNSAAERLRRRHLGYI